MSLACAATMNRTKIAVMVKRASPNARETSPITYRRRMPKTTAPLLLPCLQVHRL